MTKKKGKRKSHREQVQKMYLSGMKQADIARALNITESTVSVYCKELTHPEIVKVKKKCSHNADVRKVCEEWDRVRIRILRKFGRGLFADWDFTRMELLRKGGALV